MVRPCPKAELRGVLNMRPITPYRILFNDTFRAWSEELCRSIVTIGGARVLKFKVERENRHVTQFYYLAMNIIIGVNLSLLASRVYYILDNAHKFPQISFNFWLSVAVTVQILLTTYFEYYFFIQTLKTTNHLADSLSALTLGIFQGIVIYSLSFIQPDGHVGVWWLVWEFIYIAFGILLTIHAWIHIESSHMHHSGKVIYGEGTLLSVVFCVEVQLIILVAIGLRLSNFKWMDDLLLVGVWFVTIMGTLKSFRYLNKWDKSKPVRRRVLPATEPANDPTGLAPVDQQKTSRPR
jgi:hypothetical protein